MKNNFDPSFLRSGSIEKVTKAFGKIRQALDAVTIGYGEFKDALVTALFKQSLGIRGGHILVFGPTGTAKTKTTKGLARILGGIGTPIPYERVQGNPDTMPSDFLFRRTADYGEDGRLKFAWNLQKIGVFEKKDGQLFPGLFQFDELDKVTANGQFALLEAMEEQQVTVFDGRTVGLNFTLVATANTRKFDPTAKALSRAVQDRFGAVVLLGYQGLKEDLEMLEKITSTLREPEIRLTEFPFEELKELRQEVEENGLPLRVSSDMRERITKVVKLTQEKLAGYTDFTPYIKVPAGPRAILDLYWEAGVLALLNGAREFSREFPLACGVRVLRGRVEVTPEAEIQGMSTDVLITKILAEVFSGAASSKGRPTDISREKKEEAPAAREVKEEKAGEKESGEEAKDSEDSDKESEESEAKSKETQKPPDSTVQKPQNQSGYRPEFSRPTSVNREESKNPSEKPDWQKEFFLADFRKEANKSQGEKPRDQKPRAEKNSLDPKENSEPKEKQVGEENSPKETKEVSPGDSKSREDIHGGENASGEVPESTNTSPEGEEKSDSGQNSQLGESPQEGGNQTGEEGSQSPSSFQEGKSGDSPTGQAGRGGSQSSSSQVGESGEGSSDGQTGEGFLRSQGLYTTQCSSKSQTGSGQLGEGQEGSKGGNSGKTIKTIASREALAQWLAQERAAEQFRTKEGLKTGAEIAEELSRGKEKFDFESQDAKFKAFVRGEKAIAQGEPHQIKEMVEKSQQFGRGETGGALAGKGSSFPTLDVFSFPPYITSVLPMLRELSGEKVVEKLGEWIQLPSNQKARTGAEYRLIKGFVHLAALQAVKNSEEAESSELTLSAAGERVDFTIGPRDDLALDEERTIMEALSQGGVVDDLSEVREKRVRADAPQILFVLDGSGSMGYENRMMSAAVAAVATAQKYGPLGATQGLIAFTSKPAVVVPMPESEAERVVDGIFSVSPGGGTSYATALELAFRHAPPKTTVVVLGDFIDSSFLSQEALAIKNSKEIKVVGIVSSAGNPSYASEICDEAYLVGFDDPASVALIAIKASAN